MHNLNDKTTHYENSVGVEGWYDDGGCPITKEEFNTPRNVDDHAH